MADEDVESPGEPRLIPSPIITAIPRAASTGSFIIIIITIVVVVYQFVSADI